jgi:tetratricopeptide (TPR) repeat protein
MGISSDVIVGEFQNMTNEILVRKNDRVLYKKCYDEMVRNITDQDLIGELNYLYNYENGRIYYNTGNYAKARPFLVEAFKRQPNNADLGSVVVACLTQSFRNINDTKVILDSLTQYQKTFPLLNDNNNFNSALGMAYVLSFGEAYAAGKVAEGDRFQKLFEELYRSDKNIEIISPDAVGRAYSNACSYYFKKGQKAKAKQYLQWGLAIVPNDYQLKVRQQMISQ